MVLFFTHIPFVVNHTINTTPPERLQQHPLLFTTNHTDRTFFVWRLNSVRPSHPGHRTILLRSEIPSGMRAKLRTVAASNNRDHARNLSYYCLLALQTWWCYSSRTSRSWWIIQWTQHHRRGCNNTIADWSVKCTARHCNVVIYIRNYKAHYQVLVDSCFKDNVKYPVWTCRNPTFSDCREPMIILCGSRDPVFNSMNPNRVPKIPRTRLDYWQSSLGKFTFASNSVRWKL